MKPQNLLYTALGFAAGYAIFGNKTEGTMGATMPTLKEISAMYPGDYRVDDNEERRGDLRSWDDRITIYLRKLNKYKTVTRRSAYKYGLASKAHE